MGAGRTALTPLVRGLLEREVPSSGRRKALSVHVHIANLRPLKLHVRMHDSFIIAEETLSSHSPWCVRGAGSSAMSVHYACCIDMRRQPPVSCLGAH